MAAAFALSPLVRLRPRRAAAQRSHWRCTQQEYFATCARGLGTMLADELRASRVGATVTTVANSGVAFTADQATAYRAVLWVRTAMRVLRLLGRAACEDDGQECIFYAVERADVDWAHALSEGRSFSVDAHGASAVAVRNAICDVARQASGHRPPPPTPGSLADVPLFVTRHRGELSVYHDLAGRSLHKRGYRLSARVHKAALNECVAAAMLLLAGYTAEKALLDPLAGSGTLLCEAALIGRNVAPGLLRPRDEPFALQRAADFDVRTFDEALDEAAAAARPKERLHLMGADIHDGALNLARDSLRGAGAYGDAQLVQRDVRELRLRRDVDLVVSNPPWGRRFDAGEVWYDLGEFLKCEAAGSTAVLFSGEARPTRELRMKASRKVPVRIGDTDCRILVYQVHKAAAKESEMVTAVQ